MDWFFSHIGELVAIVAIVTGNIVGYARLRFRTEDHSARLDFLESEVGIHTHDATAHRNPDFERRIADLGAVIAEIRADVKTLLNSER
jgi:hypothetical protein